MVQNSALKRGMAHGNIVNVLDKKRQNELLQKSKPKELGRWNGNVKAKPLPKRLETVEMFKPATKARANSQNPTPSRREIAL